MKNKAAKKSSLSGKVRIVGGQLRGSILPVADMEMLRPTPQRVRETLFNWLMPYLPGMRGLDLFAGSGVLGMEALSRGVAYIKFVERDRQLVRTLEAYIERLHQQTCASIDCADALAYLHTTPAQAYDVVFMDPPFKLDLWADVAMRLEQGGWLQAHAFIYVEKPKNMSLEMPANWHVHRSSQAGDVGFILYQRDFA